MISDSSLLALLLSLPCTPKPQGQYQPEARNQWPRMRIPTTLSWYHAGHSCVFGGRGKAVPVFCANCQNAGFEPCPLNTAATAMELHPSFIPSYSWNGWGLVYAEKVFFSPHTHDNSQCQTCVTPPFQKLGPRFDGGGQSLFLISAWKCLRTFHFFIILDIFLPNPKESVKDLVQLLNSFSKASGYKVNLNKSE